MSYLNLRLYQRNTQCLHIRKHRLAGFFVRLVVACAFAAQAPLSQNLLSTAHWRSVV